jgi:2-dehydropantoate 2-reductase
MSLAKETVEVALGLGLTLDASVIGGDPRSFLSGLDDDPMVRLTDGLTARYKDVPTKPSMLQDLEKGRPTEIEALNGYVISKGHELGLPVIANEAIVRLMRMTETEGRSLGRDALTAEFAEIV